jgi:predicted ArsR family transcriptional regulator
VTEHAASAIGSLAEPVRRDLYAYVSAQPGAIGRDQAAEALGIARHTAKFHLDRLVDEGLLEAHFQRLTGRSGPGAGRPAKVYRRSAEEISVSLPARHYDLAGRILASSVERAALGGDVMEAVGASAREAGRGTGESSSAAGDDLDRLSSTLAGDGYEPRVADERLLLDNCPFDRLARDHTELVCGLNLAYVEGVIDGLGCTGLAASLEPGAARCCVTASVTR